MRVFLFSVLAIEQLKAKAKTFLTKSKQYEDENSELKVRG